MMSGRVGGDGGASTYERFHCSRNTGLVVRLTTGDQVATVRCYESIFCACASTIKGEGTQRRKESVKYAQYRTKEMGEVALGGGKVFVPQRTSCKLVFTEGAQN